MPTGSQEREWRAVQSALEQAHVALRDGVSGESERDTNIRIRAKWAVERGLEALPALCPAPLVDPLVEALDCIVETPPMPETMREVARQALANFKAATQGDKDDH